MADDLIIVEYECAGCGAKNPLPKGIKKYLCKTCGAPNNPLPENYGTGSSAGGCVLPLGFEWKLPAGVLGDEPYITYVSPDNGDLLDRGTWVEVYGFDPKAKLADMRKRGEIGVPGYVNTSTLAALRAKLAAQAAAKNTVHIGGAKR